MNAASKPEAVGRPMEILFVEDSLTAARLTTGVLRKAAFGHRLTWLRDGREALQFLKREAKYKHAPRPDLILLDLGLPYVDGHEVLRTVRSTAELNEIPVVIMTGSEDEQRKLKGESLEVAAYLLKPVDYAKLMQILDDLCIFWRKDMVVAGEGSRRRSI
jgi:CheY-like chemotaxis protein